MQQKYTTLPDTAVGLHGGSVSLVSSMNWEKQHEGKVTAKGLHRQSRLLNLVLNLNNLDILEGTLLVIIWW